MSSLLNEIYDPETFRKNGHALVDILADNLASNLSQDQKKVIDYIQPDENYEYWKNQRFENPEQYFKAVLANSIQLQHPGYVGHQVSAPAPLAVLAGFEGLMLNSGGAIYEMSAASSTVEKLVIDSFKPYFGFDAGDGIMTSGGTLANLTALICARNIKATEDIWQNGQGNTKYAFMVSEEAHYCIDRAVRLMGWGDTGIIQVPVDSQFRMQTNYLEPLFEKATAEGIKILGIVGSAPSTSTGIYDDLRQIGSFCHQRNLWYHIDAAHGGPAAFSEKYRFLMDGCELADSITVDAHKMMMTPSLTTMLFFKKTEDSYRTFAQKAQYLWSDSSEEWYNYGKRTLECTKIMLSTRIYALISTYGMEAFSVYLDKCYDMAKVFVAMIRQNDLMEVAVAPESNIVCFRLKHDNLDIANAINRHIRQTILEDGRFYIVQTILNKKVFLRTSIMNPFTSENDFEVLLNNIMSIYHNMA